MLHATHGQRTGLLLQLEHHFGWWRIEKKVDYRSWLRAIMRHGVDLSCDMSISNAPRVEESIILAVPFRGSKEWFAGYWQWGNG